MKSVDSVHDNVLPFIGVDGVFMMQATMLHDAL